MILQQVQGVVVLPCGDIVAAGIQNYYGDFALARYVPYGELNTSFGMDGIVLTNFGTVLAPAPMPAINIPSFDEANAIALQQDCNRYSDTCKNHCNDGCNNNCKLVVVGASDVFGSDNFAVARYNCDGTPDTNFGISNTGVMVIPGFGSFCSSASCCYTER